jgi:hypothetical protein
MSKKAPTILRIHCKVLWPKIFFSSIYTMLPLMLLLSFSKYFRVFDAHFIWPIELRSRAMKPVPVTLKIGVHMPVFFYRPKRTFVARVIFTSASCSLLKNPPETGTI